MWKKGANRPAIITYMMEAGASWPLRLRPSSVGSRCCTTQDIPALACDQTSSNKMSRALQGAANPDQPRLSSTGHRQAVTFGYKLNLAQPTSALSIRQQRLACRRSGLCWLFPNSRDPGHAEAEPGHHDPPPRQRHFRCHQRGVWTAWCTGALCEGELLPLKRLRRSTESFHRWRVTQQKQPNDALHWLYFCLLRTNKCSIP